ncbi:hypothetical protein AWC38_SpisGene3737 [Stylophora pistillata]|uniref:Uncharacterized protein n=1 Tax=Stylophora pistillata TaxID=50429 RepID=A0A2B4SS96_STYPI|nr:hypothetical protein AWC38_SpisGene3737 [Stylophora pistillata]
MVIVKTNNRKIPHRCALPSAYNNCSPWAWDWWLKYGQDDVIIKGEETAQQHTTNTADQEQASTDLSENKNLRQN